MKLSLRWVLLVSAIACSAPSLAQDKVRLIGSGASFPFPIYSAWFKASARLRTASRSTIRPRAAARASRISSTRRSISPPAIRRMTDDQMKKVPGGVQLLPMTAGEVVLAYNVPGVTDLRLPRMFIPRSFSARSRNGTIRRSWPRIPEPSSRTFRSPWCAAPTAAARHSCSPIICAPSARNGRRVPASATR